MRFPFSRGKAKEALAWTGGVLERLGLTLNEQKTSIRNARGERFDFLGDTFGPHFSPQTGRESMGYSPSRKSIQRLRENVGRGHTGTWEEVRDRLNQKLSGRRQYFELGSPWKAFPVLDEYVEDRVRHFLRKRPKVPSQGTRQFPTKRIYGERGVFGSGVRWVAPARESATKPVGKPDAGNPHVRFDERGWETAALRVSTRAHPRLYPRGALAPLL